MFEKAYMLQFYIQVRFSSSQAIKAAAKLPAYS